jgi:mono/diheme cytochrome c family protein
MRIGRFKLILFALGLCLATRPVTAQIAPAPPNPTKRPFTNPFVHPANPKCPTLVFDAESKEYDAKPAEMIAPFTFYLTNVWSNEVVVMAVHPSCGCTTAKLPPTPWHIPPKGAGQVDAQVNLAGKPPGLVTKTLVFITSVGNRTVTLNVKIPPLQTSLGGLSLADRKAAMARAAADPQAIFKGDCAKCHADKGTKAFGQDLYAADCGICHESSHRDSAVPDLHALKHETDLDYWKTLITYGKPHTMMPGFAAAQGGPLSEAQITSLATFLNRTISHHFTPASMTNAAAGPSSLPSRHF